MKKWRELMGKLSNVFALRFRGVDPEPLFAELEPHVSATDLKALHQIVDEIRQRLTHSGRFEPLA